MTTFHADSTIGHIPNPKDIDIDETIRNLVDKEKNGGVDVQSETAYNNAKTALTLLYGDAISEILRRNHTLTLHEIAFTDFGYLDARLLGDRAKDVLAFVSKSISEKDDPTRSKVFTLSEWVKKISKNEIVTTYFMNQGAKERAEMKKQMFDRNSAVIQELDIWRDIRIACARRGGAPGSLPIITAQWIDPVFQNAFNSKQQVDAKITQLRDCAPRLFMNDRKKEPIKLSYIIFPGCGHGSASSYQDEGRVFIPLINPPTGKSANFSQLDVSLFTGIGSMYWSLLTPLPGYENEMDRITGRYHKWWREKDGKSMPSRCFVRDFITYMTDEFVGNQSLDKELRDIFWKFIPFSEEERERLGKRALNYKALNDKYKVEHRKKGW